MNLSLWIVLFCVFSIVNCIFLAFVFLYKKPFGFISDIFLGSLLVVLAGNFGVSLFFYCNNEISTPLLLSELTGKLTLGPLFYLFIKNASSNVISKGYLVHFIFPLIILIFGWKLEYAHLNVIYWLSLGIMFCYIVYGWYIFLQNGVGIANKYHMQKSIAISVSLIWLTFLFQAFTSTLESYVIGTLIVVTLLYWINYQLTVLSFNKQRSKIGIVVSDEKKEEVRLLILEKLNHDKIYKDPKLTLPKLAASINQPTYVVSHVVNVVFMKRFPEFINSYRVEEIKGILRSGLNSSYTIEGLAYDAGFNTLSAFYSSFKKQTGLTPKKFIERNLE